MCAALSALAGTRSTANGTKPKRHAKPAHTKLAHAKLARLSKLRRRATARPGAGQPAAAPSPSGRRSAALKTVPLKAVRSRLAAPAGGKSPAARTAPAATAPATAAAAQAADLARAPLGAGLAERPRTILFPRSGAPSPADTSRLVAGCAGDHPSVHHLLTAVFQSPPREAFYASLDDPFYEPNHRLLIKRNGQIAAHLLVRKRVMQFGGLDLPVDAVAWMGTLPEFRRQGFASRLLDAADQAMIRDGAVLGVLRTKIPHFFRRWGWALCGRHSHAQAGSRDLLAQLSARGHVPGEATLTIRPWRHVELPALMRLYRHCTAGRSGHLERTESYWRWLISRKGFDRIYVAIDGPDTFDIDDGSRIVGYSIVKEDQVLELMGSDTHPEVERELLARACSEAIERDYHMLTLHARPDDPLFELFRIAGGALHCGESHQGEVQMAKLIDPVNFLRSLCPELHRRAEACKLPRPCELGLLVEGRKLRLLISRRSVKVGRNKIGRSYLACNFANFTRLTLGHLDVPQAIAAGQLRASTQLAADAGAALFPQLLLWRSPLDDLAT